MKKLLLLFPLLLIFSCQIQYDGESKYIVKTKIVDSSGNPIKDIPIDVNVSVSNLSDNISFGKSNSEGLATLMFPPPESDDANFSVSYNTNLINVAPTGYLGKTIGNLKKSDFKDFLFNTGTIVLLKQEEVVVFKVTATQVNPNTQITAFSTNAIKADDSINFDTPENIFFPLSLLVLKNQTFTISYSVTDYSTSPNSVTSYTEEIIVGTQPSEFNISY